MKSVPFQNSLQRYQYCSDLQDFLISNYLFSSNYVFTLKWGCFHNKILWCYKMAKILLHITKLSVWSCALWTLYVKMAVGYNQRILQINKLQSTKTVQCVSLGVSEWKEVINNIMIMINGFSNSVC